jgi:hypothetical protein
MARPSEPPGFIPAVSFSHAPRFRNASRTWIEATLGLALRFATSSLTAGGELDPR